MDNQQLKRVEPIPLVARKLLSITNNNLSLDQPFVRLAKYIYLGQVTVCSAY